MKESCKIAALAIGGIVSLAMIFFAFHLFKSIEQLAGWEAVGLFLLGAVLAGAGLCIFGTMDKLLSKM